VIKVEPEASVDVAMKGLTVANCLNHIRQNRIEYLVVSLLAYSVGALDKAITYGQSICM
jgi:hypothetical protein